MTRLDFPLHYPTDIVITIIKYKQRRAKIIYIYVIHDTMIHLPEPLFTI